MALALISAAVLAISAPQDPPPTVLQDVVVEGVRRNQQTSLRYVRELSAPPFGSRTLAVWTAPICLSIDNLPPERAAMLADRVLGRAEHVGAEIAQPGCKPNVVVIFTADGPATATDLVRRNPWNFRPTSAATQLDRASLSRFGSEQRAVRWWTLNMPVDVDTGSRVVALAGEHNPMARNLEGETDSLGNPKRTTGGPPFRMIRGIKPFDGVRDTLLQTMVVVDTTLAADVSYASLADYLTMVILTQVDPQADVSGLPTILNLFSENPTVAELSRWDLDYLHALYDAPANWSNIRFQQEDIARRMVSGAQTASPTP